MAQTRCNGPSLLRRHWSENDRGSISAMWSCHKGEPRTDCAGQITMSQDFAYST